jgi:hypothetical protein
MPDPYDILITANRDEARARADRVYTAAATPNGPDMNRLCSLSADLLAEQITSMHRAFKDMDVPDHEAIHRTEAAIIEAFQARMGELMGTGHLQGAA